MNLRFETCLLRLEQNYPFQKLAGSLEIIAAGDARVIMSQQRMSANKNVAFCPNLKEISTLCEFAAIVPSSRAEANELNDLPPPHQPWAMRYEEHRYSHSAVLCFENLIGRC